MGTEILTNTLGQFLTFFNQGWTNLQPAINWLIGTMLAIELVLIGLWWALGGGEQLVGVMKKLLYLGFWMWVVTSFPMLAKTFVFSLAEAGEIAGGAPASHNILLDPSMIINMGFNNTATLAETMGEQGLNFGNALAYGGMWLMTIVAYIIIAWQMFYTVLEFYIVLALVGILLPFGFFQPTKFLAEKSVGAVISSGVKLMVLSFIIAVSSSMLATLTIGASPTIEEGITLVVITGAIAFLAWNAPGIAAGLVSGSPSLSAATGLQNSLAAGMMVAGAAMAGGAAIGGAKKAHDAIAKTRAAAGSDSGGKLASAGGKTGEAAGKAVKETTKATGQAMDAAGKGVSKTGEGMKATGQAISSAPVPVVAQVGGAAATTAGAVVDAGGKGLSTAGKAVEKSGEAAGDVVEGAGKATGKLADKVGSEGGNKVTGSAGDNAADTSPDTSSVNTGGESAQNQPESSGNEPVDKSGDEPAGEPSGEAPETSGGKDATASSGQDDDKDEKKEKGKTPVWVHSLHALRSVPDEARPSGGGLDPKL